MRARFLTAVLAALVCVLTTSAQDTSPLRLSIHADQTGPTLSRHLYGHFAEHLGNSIYGGLWVRDEDGPWSIHQDVVDALRQLDPPNLRWPGGCFADEYHWQDGVGPPETRPTMINTKWGGVVEDNSFGTHEFMALADDLGAEPFLIGNMGSGTVQEMQDWWQYLNHPGGSPMADLRAENGRAAPWNVRFWGVGNESWGCGGNMTPEYYSDLYKRYATFLRPIGDVRPFRIATGPNRAMYYWTESVMKNAARMIDGLDMHYYTFTGTWDTKGHATDFTEAEWLDMMRLAMRMDEYIAGHSAIMDRYDPEKRIWLIVGEWGTWHQPEVGTNPDFLRQQNALRDALVASVTLDIFHQHAERVKMANIAQMVNVLQAMILTDGERVVRTPTYHVFEMYRVHHDATRLPMTLDRGTYAHAGESIPALSATASRNVEGQVHVSLTNMDPNRSRTVEATLHGERFTAVTGRILTAPAMNAHNTYDAPDTVHPEPFASAHIEGDTFHLELPPKSVVVLHLR